MKPLYSLVLAVGLVAVAEVSTGALLGGSVQVDLPNTFTAGTPARASEVNANFTTLETALEGLALDTDTRLDALESSGSSLARVVTVSESGADFTSVAAALASITDAAAERPYLVQLGPGVFEETQLVDVQAFVTVRGAGPRATTIRGARSNGAAGSAASIVRLVDASGLEDLAVENTAVTGVAVGITCEGIDSATRFEDVRVEVTGSGGTEHIAVLLQDSNGLLQGLDLLASGATSANVGLASTDSGGAFAQPVIKDSRIEGDNPANGVAARLSSTAARFEGCRLDGDSTGIETSTNGSTRVARCLVQTLGLNPVYSQSGSASVLSAMVEFVGGDPQGLSSQFKYVHCVRPNYNPVVNGFGSSVQ